MNEIKDILIKKGPMLSNELKKELISRINIEDYNARQRISRAIKNGKIRSFKNIRFNNNVSFVYIESHKNRKDFIKILIDKMKEEAKSYFYILKSIENKIDINRLPIYSNSTVKPLKGHRMFEDLIYELKFENIIIERNDSNQIYYQLNYKKMKNNNIINTITVSNKIERIIIKDVFDFLSKINFVAYDKLEINSEFFKFKWSFTTPSYILPMKKYIKKQIQPGFIIGDILVKNVIYKEDILYFIDKINILKNQKNISQFAPFYIGYNFEKDAFDELKKNGVIIINVQQFFSKKYYETLKNIFEIFIGAYEILKENPEKIIKLFEKLEKLEGEMNNIKCESFELIPAYYLSIHTNYNNFEFNKIIKYQGKEKEIDLIAINNDKEIKIIECKATRYEIDIDYTEKWIKEKIPFINKWLKNNDFYRNKKIIHEIWSTGGFYEDSLNLLRERKESTKKYQINYYDYNDMCNLFENDNKLREILYDNYSVEKYVK